MGVAAQSGADVSINFDLSVMLSSHANSTSPDGV